MAISCRRPSRWLLAVGIFCGALIVSCAGDEETPTGPGGESVTGLTAAGWDDFEAGNPGDALVDFAAALALDAGYGPALAGMGWAQLELASSAVEMQAAIVSFTAAADAGEDDTYVHAGRACAMHGSGQFEAAAGEALAAAMSSPGFVFSHRQSFNGSDLMLVVAHCRAALGDIEGTLASSDLVADSGIESDQPTTWQVGQVTYTSFTGAVLAHLQAVTNSHAG